ncbi:Hsp20/alpha crystallin family protein [Rufibacter sediminis]|uniref:Hsp20/alpha crystallin family protein n=1 Tax=Rufibacter sediminis TaxID=2762756 RepID=A0ABR6VUV5_9BACT|nr:Hsp20/alpha crystallin family protein [Rufibacter sediminis]MBC3540705.1 Hsp20/alpha crystallin family protein [Rufibacter sediminis]
MAIQRLGSGFDDMMPQTFSSMLDRFFNDSVNTRERLNRFSPQVDTCETETGYELEMALPGLKKEDIHLDFQQGLLTVSGERHFKNEQKDKRYHLVESQYGSFSRSFQFPDTVKPDSIEAVYENGVLHVRIPKDEQKTAKRRIEVREGAAQPIQLEKDNAPASDNQASASSSKKKQVSLAQENGTH